MKTLLVASVASQGIKVKVKDKPYRTNLKSL